VEIRVGRIPQAGKLGFESEGIILMSALCEMRTFEYESKFTGQDDYHGGADQPKFGVATDIVLPGSSLSVTEKPLQDPNQILHLILKSFSSTETTRYGTLQCFITSL